MKKYSCTIESIVNLNPTTQKLLLQLPDDQQMNFKAGQYLDIILPTGKQCPFSIANAPAKKNQLELHIRPTPGSVDSQQIDELLRTSSVIDIEAPKGECYLEVAPSNPLILLAAATGITQMKSILEYVFEQDSGYPIHLYWGVVTDEDLYLDQCWHEWAHKNQLFTYVPVVSEPERCPDWTGRTGLVPDALLDDFPVLSEETVYISGGSGMVYATLDLLLERGLQKKNIHSDIFKIAPRPDNIDVSPR